MMRRRWVFCVRPHALNKREDAGTKIPYTGAMTDTVPSPPHDLAGRTWARLADALDRQLAPLGHGALLALAPRKGERILDVGCGAGQTCVQLADAVGPSGRVLGIDISPALVAAAQRRTRSLPPVQIVEADAQTYGFEPKSYDALFSRFGVMAFRDPVAAFTNLRRALKEGGRVAFVCWRPLQENDLDAVPLAAARAMLPPQLIQSIDETAPFSFAEPTEVKRVLTEAGFQNIQIDPYEEQVACGDMSTALDLALSVGPLGKIVRENPTYKEQVSEPVQRALAQYEGPDGVRLKASVWIVRADWQ